MSHVEQSRHLLVTGASSGIGAAVTARLARNGTRVTGLARRPAASDSAEITSLALDCADLDAVCAADNRIRELAPLDGAVFCHGVGDFGAIEQFSAARIRRLIDTNLTSTILLTRLVMPLLKQRSTSTLILIGSEAALRGGRQGAVYAASKFALRGLAQSLREESASSGVRVCLLNPGMVDTPFFDDLHFAPGEHRDNALSANDVADAVLHALNAPSHLVADEINLSPLKHVVRPKPAL